MKELNYAIVIVTYNRLNLLKECIEHAKEQTLPAAKIIVVNNCSTDGTQEYLEAYKEDSTFIISNESANLGGAGGFKKGIRLAYESGVDWIMVIDDDAILDYHCLENMNPLKGSPNVRAYACKVVTNNCIDVNHRRNINGFIENSCYDLQEYTCELATFCGLMIDAKLINEIGYPEDQYFIWFDDSEYCLRIIKHTKIVVKNNAWLNHKVVLPEEHGELSIEEKGKFTWKAYYGIRNSIHAYKKHGLYLMLLKTLRRNFAEIIRCRKYKKMYRVYAEKEKMLITAIRDGLSGCLGKNEMYSPGKTNSENNTQQL